jgi:hypothetical protein
MRTTLALATLLLSSVALAQETRGTIAGRVVDSQSAAVTGAKVAVTNVETNVVTELTTNMTGYYEASLLLPGTYRVAAEAAGFKQTLRQGLIVTVGGRLDVNIVLEVGAMTESVTVTAESPILDTSSVTSGRLYDQRAVMDLPILGNNPLLLTKLAPGVSHNGINRFANQGFTIAASEYFLPGAIGGNEWSIDGAPNNGRERQPAYVPDSDVVGEMRVDTTGFDASFGHSTGINISMMTKSGANAIHGTLTDQYWNSRWNGSPFFVRQVYYKNIAAANAAGDTARAQQLASQPMQAGAHSNNYAGTFSGPVVIPKLVNGRNKLFFFASYAGTKELRNEEATGLNKTVPTAADLRGDFSPLLAVDPVRYTVYDPLSIAADPARATHYIRTPMPGNIVPKSRMINPLYDTYVKFFPTPNNSPLDPKAQPTNNYIASSQPDNTDYWTFTNRMDYNASAAHRFFARWSYNTFMEDKYDWTYEIARHLMSNDDHRVNLGGTLDWTWTASSSTVLNANLSLNNFVQGNLTGGGRKYKPSDVGLPTYLDQKAGADHILPTIGVSGYTGIGQNIGSFTAYRTFTPRINLTHVRGRHSIRTGFEYRGQYRTNTAGGNTSGSFNFDNSFVRKNDDTFTAAGSIGLSWAAFMMGLPNSMSVSTSDSYATFNPYFGWYAQDGWRITRRLTLNLGLRLEYESGPTERYNRMLAFYDPDVKLPITDGAVAAYAAKPLAELAASNFLVRGGSVYAGENGRPRAIWGGELMWLPRVSAGFQLTAKTVLRGGYGIFYDTLNVLNLGIDQYGYDRATSTTLTTDYGKTWLAGDPAKGISPLNDPFPVRADGTRFNDLLRSSLGTMAVAGRSFTYNNWDAKHGRVQRWRAAVQRQLTPNSVVEAAYNGSWADHLSFNTRIDALPQQYWSNGTVRTAANDAVATDLNQNVTNPYYIGNFASLKTSNPVVYQQMSTLSFFTSSTIRKATLLRPRSNISGLYYSNNPIALARTHSLEFTYERRMSKGFNLNLGYSMMQSDKYDTTLNEFEVPSRWTATNNGRPHRLSATGIYDLPFGASRRYLKSGVLGQVVGGWQITATYEWQPGPLLDFGNIFFNGNFDDVPLGASQRTLDRWFNTDGFERVAAKQPASYQIRAFPTRIPDVRADMTNQWNASVVREFSVRERVKFQVRLDTLNLQNRSQFGGPSTDPTSTNFGRVTSQTAAVNRWLQIQARLKF